MRSADAYVPDVDEKLRGIVSELAKGKVRVGIGVRWIEDRRLDQSRAGVQGELQRFVLREPDAPTSDARDRRINGTAGRTEGNGNIGAEGGAGRAGVGRIVGRGGIGLQEE